MSLEESLKAAGVDTNRARVVVAAEAALRATKWRPEAALAMLLAEVRTDTRLLRGLHQISESASRELASALLQQLAADAKGPMREAVSQQATEGQCARDHRLPAPSSSSRASQALIVQSQVSRDRPAAPVSKGGASRISHESQTRSDRPSRSPAAIAVLKSGVFEKRIVETFDHRWGDITQRDYLNLRIKNAFSAAVERGLSKVKWPDMNTPLRKFCSESEVQRIAESADQARAGALSAVKAVAHV